jgi:hypothetical protein
VARRNEAMRGLARSLGMTERADEDHRAVLITELRFDG